MPLKIVVVGAGLGGLTAAFCLAKQGYNVQLFERYSSLSPRGGGIMIRPNASRCFRSWGLEDAFEAISDQSAATKFRDVHTGAITRSRINAIYSVHPDWGTNRASAQTVLHEQACKAGAKIVFGTAVEEAYDTLDAAVVVLSTGEVVRCDLVLIADGITSRLREQIRPELSSTKPIISCATGYQVDIPEHELVALDETKELVNFIDLSIWMGESGYVVGRYLAKLHKFSAVFVLFGPGTEDGSLWEANADLAYVRDSFHGWDQRLISVLQLARSCDRWRLTELPNLQYWVSNHGRLVLLGDSAHAMLPNAAQGFSQIVEDVAALCEILANDDSRHVSTKTRIWQDLRRPRVEKIKAFARSNHDNIVNKSNSVPSHPRFGDDEQTSSFQEIQPDSNAEFNTPAFDKWIYDYDIFREIEQGLFHA